MSFWKAEQLALSQPWLRTRHAGVTLDDVIERFGVSKRDRSAHAARAGGAVCRSTHVTVDDEGRKRWHLPSGALRDLMSLYTRGAGGA